MFTARTRLVCLLPVCVAPVCLLPVFLLLVVPERAARPLPPTARLAKSVKRTTVEVKAIEGFRACLSAATQQSWYNNWSRLCERELNQLQPAAFPVSSEAKPEAGYLPLTLAPASLARLE